MAKKRKAKKPTRKPKLDVVQRALQNVEKITGEKLAKPAKQPKSND